MNLKIQKMQPIKLPINNELKSINKCVDAEIGCRSRVLIEETSLPCWRNIDMLLSCATWLGCTDFFNLSKYGVNPLSWCSIKMNGARKVFLQQLRH